MHTGHVCVIFFLKKKLTTPGNRWHNVLNSMFSTHREFSGPKMRGMGVSYISMYICIYYVHMHIYIYIYISATGSNRN